MKAKRFTSAEPAIVRSDRVRVFVPGRGGSSVLREGQQLTVEARDGSASLTIRFGRSGIEVTETPHSWSVRIETRDRDPGGKGVRRRVRQTWVHVRAAADIIISHPSKTSIVDDDDALPARVLAPVPEEAVRPSNKLMLVGSERHELDRTARESAARLQLALGDLRRIDKDHAATLQATLVVDLIAAFGPLPTSAGPTAYEITSALATISRATRVPVALDDGQVRGAKAAEARATDALARLMVERAELARVDPERFARFEANVFEHVVGVPTTPRGKA